MNVLPAEAVAAAARRLQGVVNHTPVLTSRTLNRMTGKSVFLKCENFQRVGAFKFRGAYNAISSLDADSIKSGIITHSSGNHAQGVALASQLLGVKAVVVMPNDAPIIKREATAGYGAEIVPCEAIERESKTDELIDRHGYTLIHPYDNDDIIAGQGTAAWELFEEVGELDLLFVPVGGGGLISGCALAASMLSPGCRVIGVEPQIADDARRSWLAGQVVVLDHVPPTVADGLRPRQIGGRNLAIMRRHVADMTTVTESEIVSALQLIWQRLKILVEPSAAVALAPLLAGYGTERHQRVGVLLSGGNVDLPALMRQLEEKSAAFPIPESRDKDEEPRPRVLVTGQLNPDVLTELKKGASLDIKPGISETELQEIIGDYHGLIVDENTTVSGQVIEYGYNLRVVSLLGDRLDNLDVSAARALGIDVHYEPGRRAMNEAELTLGLMLDLLGRPNLNKDDREAAGLAGKTLGLVGYGRTGLLVAQRAASFDMRVLVNQPRLTPELALSAGIIQSDLDTLLREADIVSLHLPSNAETSHLLDRPHLERMKPEAYLINQSFSELVDFPALVEILAQGRLRGAAVISPSDGLTDELSAALEGLQAQGRVHLITQPSEIQGQPVTGRSSKLIAKTLASLRSRLPSETLSLDILAVEQVLPHEMVDDKRVARLMSLLERDALLVNPPIVLPWQGRYIVLDGATRYTALDRLGFKFLIAQIVSPSTPGFDLHTWYHVISGAQPFSALRSELATLPGLRLAALDAADLPQIFINRPAAICYFIDRHDDLTLVEAINVDDKLAAMRDMVAHYTAFGQVERTLLADKGRLLSHFPNMIAAAIFPQFKPDEVFGAAARGDRLPAGLTRFVIAGRILRLKADLSRLKRDEPLAAKKVWLNRLLADRLASSRLRYYEEPVVLLDE